MKDNFDLKKFILENKVMENSNQFTNSSTPKQSLTEGNLRDKIREMILNELSGEEMEYGMESEMDDMYMDDEDVLFEQEEEEEEEIENEETETEETPTDEDESAFGTIAADMEGSEAELMDNLMSALKSAKGLNNEKLVTQIGNTLKFFVSEYIGGEE
jgi:hypothetical protein